MRIQSRFAFTHSLFCLFILLASVAFADSTKFDHYPVCSSCIGAQKPDSGFLISDMESVPRIQNSSGGHWYVATDSADEDSSTASPTRILAGATRDSAYATGYRFQVTEGMGSNASYVAYVDFELGKGSGDDTLEAFLALGTKLSDALGTQHSNFHGSTGLSFDYWTSDSATFDFIRLEARANNEYENEKLLHGLVLPATKGQWVSVYLQWTDLTLPDWVDMQNIPANQRGLNINAMDKIQWVVQEPTDSSGDGASGAFAVDNVKVHGFRPWSCAAVKCTDLIQKPKHSPASRTRREVFKRHLDVTLHSLNSSQPYSAQWVNLKGQNVPSK